MHLYNKGGKNNFIWIMIDDNSYNDNNLLW